MDHLDDIALVKFKLTLSSVDCRNRFLQHHDDVKAIIVGDQNLPMFFDCAREKPSVSDTFPAKEIANLSVTFLDIFTALA